MPREPRRMSAEEVARKADRAEGKVPEAPESPGRPPRYQTGFAGQAEKLCKLGATDADLADFFEVSIRTIERWRIEHGEFCRAVKGGKDETDDRVERSLYQKAVGYTFESEKLFQYAGEVVRAKTREHVLPDTTAAIFWLKNRRKAEWRDRSEQVTGTPDDFSRMDDGELEAEIARLSGGAVKGLTAGTKVVGRG